MNINTYELIKQIGEYGLKFEFIKKGEYFYIVMKAGPIPHEFDLNIGTLANYGGYENAWEIHEGDLS